MRDLLAVMMFLATTVVVVWVCYEALLEASPAAPVKGAVEHPTPRTLTAPAPERSVEQIVVEYAAARRLDLAEVVAIIVVESGWRPDAQSPTNDVGLMQVNIREAERIFGFDRDTLLEPEVNVYAGTYLLQYCKKRMKTRLLAYGCYNRGERNAHDQRGQVYSAKVSAVVNLLQSRDLLTKVSMLLAANTNDGGTRANLVNALS